MDEKISVIVPVYNVDNYIKDCLETLIKQSYQNLEIILIDDGSTDNSGKICDEYALRNDSIVVVHKDNGGVSSARNLGLEIASGEWIAFVDPDDWVALDIYSTLYTNVKSTGCDISVCGYQRTTHRNVGCMSITVADVGNKLIDYKQSMDCMLDFGTKYFCGVCNKLYSRRILDGIRFNEDVTHGEDLLFNFSLYLKNRKDTIFCEEGKYFYYIRNDSACNAPEFKMSNLTELEVWKYIFRTISNDSDFCELKPVLLHRVKDVLFSILRKLSDECSDRNEKIFNRLREENKQFISFRYKKNIKEYIKMLLLLLPYRCNCAFWNIVKKIKS